MSNPRRAFADICRGHSTLRRDGKSLCIKHLSHIDQVDLDDFNEEAKEEARRKKLTSTEDKLKWLDRQKLWSEKDEKTLEATKKQVANLADTKAKLFLPSDKARMDIMLKDAQRKLNEAAHKRHRLLGLTQERYVENKHLVYYMHISLYDDATLARQTYSRKAIEKIDDDELNDLLYEYNRVIEPFDEAGIRKVAVSDTFVAYFMHAEDTSRFFARPMSEMSFYQLNLLFWARHFRDILKHASNLPEDAKGDPDKIEAFITGNTKAKEIINQGPKRGYGDGSGTQFVGIVGTADDMKQLGIKTDSGPVKLLNGNTV